MIGRRRPYTERGIKRVPCARCGRPALHQWDACAIDNRHVPVCERCDIAPNALVLRWLGVAKATRRKLIERYKKRMARG